MKISIAVSARARTCVRLIKNLREPAYSRRHRSHKKYVLIRAREMFNALILRCKWIIIFYMRFFCFAWIGYIVFLVCMVCKVQCFYKPIFSCESSCWFIARVNATPYYYLRQCKNHLSKCVKAMSFFCLALNLLAFLDYD